MEYLALLPILIYSTSAQDTIGCLVPGECQQSLYIGIAVASNPAECLDFCQETPDCNYFTHYSDEGGCFAWSYCQQFSSDACTDCVSGDAICRVCSEQGRCDGIEIDFSSQTSEVACLDKCAQLDGCGWYSYDSSNSFCILTTDCEIIENCSTCSYGQKECDCK